jgi:hypothetical protein
MKKRKVKTQRKPSKAKLSRDLTDLVVLSKNMIETSIAMQTACCELISTAMQAKLLQEPGRVEFLRKRRRAAKKA